MMKPLLPIRTQNTRTGATLVEVLMSLLIMSIGIVSVFSLFPIAILSSIKATQLTSSRIGVDNVFEQVRTSPEFILGARPWESNTTYTIGEVVTPEPKSGHFLPKSRRRFRVRIAGDSGAIEPVWNGGGDTNDGSGPLVWEPVTVGLSQYVIDELGRDIIGGAQGAEFSNGTVTGPARIDLAAAMGVSVAAIEDRFAIQDTWTVVLQAVPTGVSASGVTFANDDLSGVDTSYRVTVLSADGTQAATRTVGTTVTGHTIPLANPLPANLDTPAEVSTARVEVFERRYTWLMSVNREVNGDTRAQCVVFYKRSYSLDDEFQYSATINGSRDSWDVTWATTDPQPLIRESNYAYHVEQNRWHKIVSAPTASGGTLVLETPLEGTGPATFVFMRGIVDVYDY